MDLSMTHLINHSQFNNILNHIIEMQDKPQALGSSHNKTRNKVGIEALWITYGELMLSYPRQFAKLFDQYILSIT